MALGPGCLPLVLPLSSSKSSQHDILPHHKPKGVEPVNHRIHYTIDQLDLSDFTAVISAYTVSGCCMFEELMGNHQDVHLPQCGGPRLEAQGSQLWPLGQVRGQVLTTDLSLLCPTAVNLVSTSSMLAFPYTVSAL